MNAHQPWPQSLIASNAIDELARALYIRRQEYYGLPTVEWSQVPYHLRSGFCEAAKVTLETMGTPPDGGHDPALFAFSTLLARSRTVIATWLGPTHGRIIGAIGRTE